MDGMGWEGGVREERGEERKWEEMGRVGGNGRKEGASIIHSSADTCVLVSSSSQEFTTPVRMTCSTRATKVLKPKMRPYLSRSSWTAI